MFEYHVSILYNKEILFESELNFMLQKLRELGT